MTRGDARPEYDAMLRRKAGIEPHDPGDVGGDPAASRVIYALLDLGVEGQATAVDVLAACGGAGLTQRQVKLVLAAFRHQLRPVGPGYLPPGLNDPEAENGT